jgi:tetratricopeptide (TPR) repeat protein
VIGVITLVSYSNCVTNQFVFDDFHLIVENPTIRGIEKIPHLLGMGNNRGSYRPVRMISYAVDFSLNKSLWQYFGRPKNQDKGLNPFGYHLSNLFYHILTSFLVFLITKRLVANYRVALLAASLFALHPVHTDSVAYLSGRRDILFTLFYLAGFYFFLCYRKRRKLLYLAVSLLAYLLSLGSKEMAVTLPAIFLCYDLVENLPNNTQKISPPYFKELFFTFKRVVLQSRYLYFPLFTGALAYSYYNVFIKSPSHQNYYYGDSILTTFLTVGKILVHYMWLLVYPIRLNADYSYNAFPLSSSFFEPATFFSLILLGGIGYALLKLLVNHKVLAFGGIWFFVTLLPVCHIFPHHELLAEHYLYLPSYGFCLIVAYLLNCFLEEKRNRSYIYASFAALVILFSLRIVDRNKDWRDELTLWRKTVTTVPQCARAHNNLGYTYVKQGIPNEAISEYKKALAIKPRNVKALYNLGSAYDKKGDFDNAILKLQEALALKPRYAKAHHKMGSVYSKKGMLGEAVSEYKKALTIKPRDAKAHYNLGNVYHKKGDFDNAISEYKRALVISPNNADAHYNLGFTYDKKGMLDDAIIEYMKALAINPTRADVHYNLSVVYYNKRKYEMALFHCDRATGLGSNVNPQFLELLESYR